ncbi:MAG: MFS transporter [Luteolibacter sp.]|uniref:MFS transporter n=1 Tax=Luteolibacter sp. TaxID=1962973 RepID=UPI0032674E35
MTNTDVSTVPNAKRLLAAGFTAILAAGVGFAIRGGILDNWQKEFNFTGAQLGAIGGAGLSGFCFGIIIGGVIVDKIGYGKLVLAALLFHIISAFVTFGASTPANAYNFLFWGSFIFAFANGTLEAVANPLVATIFPKQRTHYLNILHAAWPAGMILGTALGWVLDDKLEWNWKIQLGLYLIPVALYGIMFLGQKFPKSEAAAKGASFVQMFKSVGILGALVACFLLSLFFADIFKGILTTVGQTAAEMESTAATSKMIGYGIGGALLITVAVMTRFSIGSFLLFVLFVTHALIGSVELGTDSWIQNITGNIFSSEKGKYLFIWTSAIMFGLRFCAHFIEKTLKVSPIGLLLICSVIACIGLHLASNITSFGMALLALGIYAIGKTFFWPTMLAVVGDRFPQTGAVAMSIMGGIGMLSVGVIGGPGLGYLKDRYSGEELKKNSAELYAEYESATPSKFLDIEATSVKGLDGTKLGKANDLLKAARAEVSKAGGDPATAITTLPKADQEVITASINGDRHTLKTDAIIPAIMAAIYVLLFLYFKSIGGYRPMNIEELAGGVEGPVV